MDRFERIVIVVLALLGAVLTAGLLWFVTGLLAYGRFFRVLQYGGE